MRTTTMAVQVFLHRHCEAVTEVFPSANGREAVYNLETLQGLLEFRVKNIDPDNRTMQFRLNVEQGGLGNLGKESEILPGAEKSFSCRVSEQAAISLSRRFGESIRIDSPGDVLAALLGMALGEQQHSISYAVVNWSPLPEETSSDTAR